MERFNVDPGVDGILRWTYAMRCVKVLCLFSFLSMVADLSAQQRERWEIFSSIGWRDLQKGDDQPVGDGMDIGLGIGFRPFSRVGFEIEAHRIRATGSDGVGLESILTEKGYWTRTTSRKNDDRVHSISGNIVFHFIPSRINYGMDQLFLLCGISLVHTKHRQTLHVVEQGVRPDKGVQPISLRAEPDRSSRFEPGLGIGGGMEIFVNPRVSIRGEAMNLASWSYSFSFLYPYYLPLPNYFSAAIAYHW